MCQFTFTDAFVVVKSRVLTSPLPWTFASTSWVAVALSLRLMAVVCVELVVLLLIKMCFLFFYPYIREEFVQMSL